MAAWFEKNSVTWRKSWNYIC